MVDAAGNGPQAELDLRARRDRAQEFGQAQFDNLDVPPEGSGQQPQHPVNLECRRNQGLPWEVTRETGQGGVDRKLYMQDFPGRRRMGWERRRLHLRSLRRATTAFKSGPQHVFNVFGEPARGYDRIGVE